MRQKVGSLQALAAFAIGSSLNSNTVAKHNTHESCWVILYGKVYDVRSNHLRCIFSTVGIDRDVFR